MGRKQNECAQHTIIVRHVLNGETRGQGEKDKTSIRKSYPPRPREIQNSKSGIPLHPKNARKQQLNRKKAKQGYTTKNEEKKTLGKKGYITKKENKRNKTQARRNRNTHTGKWTFLTEETSSSTLTKNCVNVGNW